VPGIGFKSAYKIISARKYAALTYEDLVRMRVVMKRAVHFITCNGKFFGQENLTAVKNLMLIAERTESSEQMNMFSSGEIATSVLTGEL